MKVEFSTLRPCLILSTKQYGLCHGIFQNSYIVAPSLFRGGDNGGVVAEPLAIVELRDGTIERVTPVAIRFLDNKFDEYDFGEDIEDGVSEEDKLKILDEYSRGEK